MCFLTNDFILVIYNIEKEQEEFHITLQKDYINQSIDVIIQRLFFLFTNFGTFYQTGFKVQLTDFLNFFIKDLPYGPMTI